MNIFEEFRSAAANANNADNSNRMNNGTAAPAGAANNPTVPSGATPGSDGNGPAAFPATAGVQDQEKSPLSGFEKLWENDPKNPVKDPLATVSTKFNIDPAKLAAAAKNMDFAGMIPKEVIDAAMKGDPAAFAQAMNAVTQAAFVQSASANARVVEAAVNQTAEKMLKEVLPQMVRDSSIANHVRTENPLFKNPAAAPLVEMLQKQVQTKYPTATAAEINSQVSSYLNDFAKMVVSSKIGEQPDPAATAGSGVVRKTGGNTDDWGDFFGIGTQQ